MDRREEERTVLVLFFFSFGQMRDGIFILFDLKIVFFFYKILKYIPSILYVRMKFFCLFQNVRCLNIFLCDFKETI